MALSQRGYGIAPSTDKEGINVNNRGYRVAIIREGKGLEPVPLMTRNHVPCVQCPGYRLHNWTDPGSRCTYEVGIKHPPDGDPNHMRNLVHLMMVKNPQNAIRTIQLKTEANCYMLTDLHHDARP